MGPLGREPPEEASTAQQRVPLGKSVPPRQTPAETLAADRRQGIRVLGVTTLGLMFVIINGTSVNVALPAMSDYFGVQTSTADWFLLSFMLANTASILVFGRISDMLGRKRIYLVGLAIFVVLSALSALAPTAGILILLRTLQGIAAAAIFINTGALITDAFPPYLLAYGLGLNLTAAAVGNTIGPTVGGVLITVFGWQSIFLVNVPFGIAAIALGMRVLPTEEKQPDRGRFDYGGAVLSTLGLAGLLYGVNQISVRGITDPWVATSLIVGVLMLVAFGVLEAKIASPLVDVALVKDYARACAYGAAFFNSFCRAGVTVLIVLQQQLLGGRTAAEAGVVVMVLAIFMMIGSPLAGRLSATYSARTLSGIGSVGLLVGTAGLTLSVHAGSLVWFLPWLAIAGFGIGCFTTANTTSIMAGIAPNRRATANGVRSLMFNSAQALGTTVALLLISAAGVKSYASAVAGPEVQRGFEIAYVVLAVSAAAALVMSVARGGAWRVAPQAVTEPSTASS